MRFQIQTLEFLALLAVASCGRNSWIPWQDISAQTVSLTLAIFVETNPSC